MSDEPRGAKALKCPICGKVAVEAYKPFCSKRCADIDLARWFTGSYAIAGRDDDDDGGAAPVEGGARRPADGREEDD
jgi:uncharacterized protein